ncbi:MAG: hypothetical protein WAL11_16645, partial [Pseudolabrys sp.]
NSALKSKPMIVARISSPQCATIGRIIFGTGSKQHIGQELSLSAWNYVAIFLSNSNGTLY